MQQLSCPHHSHHGPTYQPNTTHIPPEPAHSLSHSLISPTPSTRKRERRRGREERKRRKEEEEEERIRRRSLPHGQRMSPASCCTSTMPLTSPEWSKRAPKASSSTSSHGGSPELIYALERAQAELLLLELPQGMVRHPMKSIFIFPISIPNPMSSIALPW